MVDADAVFPRRPLLGQTAFAVVDVETTGFSPRLHDRVVEVAVVRLFPDAQPAREYASLVNPGRDVGPTHVHGVTATDVANAPSFGEIAGDIGQLFDDAIIVAHNLRFDRAFLESEFDRIGHPLPAIAGICTLDLTYRLMPTMASRRLDQCCSQLGVAYEAAHSALGDARTAAALLIAYLDLAAKRGLASLESLGCRPLALPPPGWLNLSPSGRSLSRGAAVEVLRRERGYLARLVESLPGTDAPDATTAAYLGLLDRALEDRRISGAEAEALMATATDWGLSRAHVLDVHRGYLRGLVAAARADGLVTPSERADLNTVCDLLGLHSIVLDELLAQDAPPAPEPGATAGLSGKSVCFTGALSGHLDGQPITRERAEQAARDHGLRVVQSVSRDTDLLVVADPNTASGKAKKARQCGTRIMAEAVFWRSLGVDVD